MRVRVMLLFAAFISSWLWLDARAQSGGPIVRGAHRFEKVTDGVYYATASGTMTVGANSPIIVTDTEAVTKRQPFSRLGHPTLCDAGCPVRAAVAA